MISSAQKIARENFKKAIEYRKKTGCTLKQAFAYIKGKKAAPKKVGAVKKKAAPKKIAKKKVAPKKVAKKKAPKKLKYAGTLKAQDGKKMYKYSLGKKPTEKTILNKIHKVKKEVDKLDEAQHKHMSGDDNILGKIKDQLLIIKNLEDKLKNLRLLRLSKSNLVIKKIYLRRILRLKNLIREHKLHITQLKKHI